MPKRNILLFLVLIISSFLLMTYQSKKGHLLSNTFLNDLLNTSYEISRSISEAVKRPINIVLLREEENEALKEQVDNLILEREHYREALLENNRLKELLDLSERASFRILRE